MTDSRFRRGRLLAVAALMLGLAGGCGGKPTADVKGKVTLDGKPLAEGSIEFFPIAGDGQTAATTVKDGEFRVTTSVCKMKVSINAPVVVGRRKAYETPDSPMIEDVKNIIPAKYNTATELKADLVPGTNEVNFELFSDPKKK